MGLKHSALQFLVLEDAFQPMGGASSAHPLSPSFPQGGPSRVSRGWALRRPKELGLRPGDRKFRAM